MDTSKNKLFLVITLFNIIVTVLMVVFFINIDKVFTKSMKKNTEIYVGAGGPEYLGRSETSSTKSDDSIIASKPLDYIDRSDWTSTYDDAALRLLHDRLENKSFYVSDSIIFSFGLSNMFSGFFDSNNSNVYKH